MKIKFCSKCCEQQIIFFKGRKCESCFKSDREISNKKYQQTHKNIVNTITKKYKDKNKQIMCEKNKIYKENNKEKIAIYNRQPYVKEAKNSRARIERKNNPAFRLREIVSGAINVALKKSNVSKNKQSFLKYVNYTMQELKDHLQSQFEPWMSWNNWGKYNKNTWNDHNTLTWTWNIDHIIPHSNFKYILMKDQSFKDCWALNNLRPLSAKVNLLKGNR